MLRTILDVVPKLWPELAEATWRPWLLCAAAVFGLTYGLSDEDLAFIARGLGRTTAPTAAALEAWLVVGRRGGKSMFAAVLAVYLACCRTYTLARGERGVGMILAADRRQARVIKRYVSGLLQAVPALADLIVNETKDAIELSNGITIEIHTASFRTTRGYTVVFAIADEIAFWPVDDSANPDAEILNALRPAMATVPGALLLALSSPYARRGELWKAWKQHYGRDDDPVLVWQADTRTMNPTVPLAIVERAYAEDPAVAAAEYGAQFRRDVESFVPQEVIDGATIAGRHQLPPAPGVEYYGFIDPAGGSGADSFTAAVAHREGPRIVLDVVLERRPPFSPETTVAEFADVFKAYRVFSRVASDRWGGDWPREAFAKHGVTVSTSDRTASEIYRDVLPLLNSGVVELLDIPRLAAQLLGLERRPSRSGRDLISHSPNAHDDSCNAACGALLMAADNVTAMTEAQIAQLHQINDDAAFTNPNGQHAMKVL